MPNCAVDLDQMDFYRLLLYEHACKDAEIAYAKNPLDAENLSKWGKALLELSQFQNPSDSLQFVKDSASKLEEALLIHPRNHDILWCLGNAHISHALFLNDLDLAKIYFGKATQCFQQALEEDPDNEIYMKSLEFSIKLKLDELVTELHALKRQYGLLQKNSTGLARPNHPTAHFLDEKSSLLLKKLLDVATQQVLYSQAKMISYTPEMPKSEGECNNLNSPEIEKYQEFHSVVVPEKSSEPANLALVAEPKMFQNPIPLSEPARASKLLSKHAAIDNSNRCISSRTSELGSMRKPSQPLKSTSHRVKPIRSGSCSHRLSSKNGGELTLIPAQKPRQVEPRELVSQVSSQSQKSDRICRKLTHHKRKKTPCISSDQVESNRIESLQPTQRSKSRVSNGTARITRRNDRLTESKTQAIADNHMKFARLNRSKAWKYLSSSESSRLNSASNSSTRSIQSPPSELRTIHSRRRKASPRKAMVEIVQKNDRLAESKSRSAKQVKPSRSNHSSRFSARSKKLTPTRQSRLKARRMPSQLSSPPPRNRLSLVPHQPASSLRPTKASQESKDEEVQGKFRRLKNKLSVIFHHHHHHHLHAREGENKGREEVRSLWKHLMAALHLSSGSGKEAAAKGRRHGYLHVMIEGLLHHLWEMRWRRWRGWRRREKVASRRKSKKLRWWAWFRRRGGVVVGGRRRMRQRMVLSGSSRRIA